ncbi:MAG: hypothetical protein JRI76_08670 [Deltaproteobacteria bacterium]|nr:hypothetical protein [Deltaproteobacteria bacterium]MBW1954281.1 hypothetical protein [Deltaproteobacteria bacterium]MBW2042092.1 hypothetical protein [Deltaproteobacteria bacterium]MBW2132585.1 hypothetical protein [Deltaproteobacteria bacterium]
MDEHEKEPRFQIGGEERPDSILPIREEVPEIKKVSHRVTRVAVLILLLVGAGFAVGYFELKKRFNQIYNEGAQGFSAISQNVEVRFSSLIKEQEKLKETLTGQIRTLEKNISELKTALKQSEKQLAALDAAKVNKKELETITSKTGQNVTAIKKDLAALSESIPRLEQKLSLEITQIAEAIQKININVTRVQEEVKALSVKKMDKAIFEVKWKNEEKIIQKMLDEATREYRSRIRLLEKRLDLLEKKTTPPPAASAPPAPKPEPSPSPVTPGKIEEESIKE